MKYYNSLITSNVKESKMGHIKDLISPVLRHELRSDKQAQFVIEAGGLFQQKVGEALEYITNMLSVSVTVHVDYDRSLEDAVKAGKYPCGDSNIASDKFPEAGTGIKATEVFFLNFGVEMNSYDALPAIESFGLRPANLRELLAVGEEHPSLQNEFPIVALGSIWKPHHERWFVPALGLDRAQRELRLKKYSSPWSDVRRFAAVRG